MPPTILVIEDDPDVLRLVKDDLEQAGYRVLTAPDGVSGLTSAHENDPDLVLLDLVLPDLAGAEVARQLRKTSTVPIVVLTAVDGVHSKVDLLGAGADDYLTKPFHLEELLARIRVQLRAFQGQQVVQVGTLSIRVRQRRCYYDGHDIFLSEKEFDLLALLAQYPGRVYDRERIVRELWKGERPGNVEAVDVHEAHLRMKFRQRGGHEIIRTVRGIVFALRAPR